MGEELVQSKPLAREITPLVQRQVEEEEEEETIQGELISRAHQAVQKQAELEEEEILHPKKNRGPASTITSNGELRRQVEEEEAVQTKLSIPLVRKNVRKEEEKQIQTKPLFGPISLVFQPQVEDDEEEEAAQEKSSTAYSPDNQRHLKEDAELEEEETVQPKSLMQRQAEEEGEESVRLKLLTGQLTHHLQTSVRGPGHSTDIRIQRLRTECEEELQRQPEEEDELTQPKSLGNRLHADEETPFQLKGGRGQTPQVTPTVAAHIQALRGGSPLPRATRSFFQSRFGTDFSSVRLHTDTRAAETAKRIQARAFTVGQNIAFGAGQYAPESREGQQLLAHELTHVVQQGGGRLQEMQTQSKKAAAQGGAPLEQEKVHLNFLSIMESAFGADFSGVNIYTGSRALQMNRALGAQAFARSSDIYFNRGKYDTQSRSGQRSLTHELTHTIQPGGAGMSVVQRAVPDDQKTSGDIDKQKAHELNRVYWDSYNLEAVRPLRELNPSEHPNAYANRTLQAQRLLRASGQGTTLIGKRLARDGILGPRTLLVMRLVAVNPSMADLRFEMAGLGVDLESLAADEAWGGAREALIDIRQPTFVAEWTTEGPGEAVIDNIVRTDEATTTAWYDEVLFGGVVPADLAGGQLSLGDRHEILRRAYETAAFRGRAGLVKEQRNFLDERRDVGLLVKRDAEKGGATHTVRFVAGNGVTLEKWEGLFGLTYPEGAKVERAREEIVSGEEFEETGLLTGLLLVYYLPELTDAERLRLLAQAYEYVQDRKEGIEGFVHPQGDKLVALLDDEDLAWYRFADRLEALLRRFRGRPDLFEALLDYLRGHEQGNYFAALIDRSETLRVIPTLALVVRLLLDSSKAGHEGTQRLIDRLQALKAKYQRHDYVTGDDPGVRLDKDADKFLRVGEVAGEKSSVYRKEETRHVLKEGPREALEAELKVQLDARLKEIFAAEADGNPYAGKSEEEFGRMILEAAAEKVGLTEDDFKEVSYEESLRLNGVRSETIDGVEEFFVDFEVVSRIDGGEWDVLEPSAGYQPQSVFADRLFWYYFGNVAELIETIAIAEMIVVGGFVAWSVGAMSFLVALAGGKTVVGISIAISVLFWAITADHLTLEGFLKAVVEGYLGALGFTLFAPVGAGLASLVGTTTFKRKLIGLALQTFVAGAGEGAIVGFAMVLVDDILRGELSSPGRYLKGMVVGMVVGIVAEFVGTGVIAPIFRTAGRNVLEKIATIESLKDFVEKAGKKFTSTVWLSEMTGGLSRFRQWLAANVDDDLAAKIFAHAREKTEQFLKSYLTGLELSIQRQALALAEVNLSREAVEGLERLIRVTTRTADEDVVSDVLNELVKKVERADPFLRLIEKADDGLMKNLTAATGLTDLATADFGLTLARARSGREMANLLDLRFGGIVDDFDDYARRLLDTSETAQAQVLDVLATRGAAVTPESVLRIAQAGVELTDEVVGGLARLVRSVPDVEGLEGLLRSVPDDEVGGFLTYVREVAPPDFDRLLALVKKGDLDERLFGLVDAPVGIRTLELVGELRAIFPALADPKLAGAVKTLLDHGVSAADLRTIIQNVDGVLAHSPAGDKLFNIQNFAEGLAHAKDVKQFDFMMNQLRNKGSQLIEVVDAITYATLKNRWHLFDAIFDAKVLGRVLPVPRGFPAPGDFTTFSKGIRSVMSEIGTDLDIRVQGSSLIDFPGKAVKDIDVAVMMNAGEFTEALKKAFFKEYRTYVKRLNDILPAGKQRPVPTGAGDVSTKDFLDFVDDVRGMGSGDVTRRGVKVNAPMTSVPMALDKGKVPDSKFLSKTKKRERDDVVESLKGLEEGGERTIKGDDTGSVLDLSLIQAGKGFDRPPFLQLKQ